jgi:hypothetical protein
VSHFSLQPLFENFAVINIYQVTLKMLVELHVGLHANFPLLVSDFNQKWNVCKFQ